MSQTDIKVSARKLAYDRLSSAYEEEWQVADQLHDAE